MSSQNIFNDALSICLENRALGVNFEQNKDLPLMIGNKVVGSVVYELIDHAICIRFNFHDIQYSNIMTIVGIMDLYAIQVFSQKVKLISYANLDYEPQSSVANFIFNYKTSPHLFLSFE